MLRCRQGGGHVYRQVVLQTANRYRHDAIDLSRPVWPGTLGNVIFLMLNAFELTSDEAYLDAAERFGAETVYLFLDDGCPLPRASHVHDHYEAVTNGDTLMMAFLRLWQVRQRPELKLRLAYCDR